MKRMEREASMKRRVNWFQDKRAIVEILREVEARKSYAGAVKHLQHVNFISGHFGGLEESTVRGWFERGSYTKLLTRDMGF